MRAVGSGLGAGGFAAYGDSACIVEVARLFCRFLHVESCAQCPPCKLNSADIHWNSSTGARIPASWTSRSSVPGR